MPRKKNIFLSVFLSAALVCASVNFAALSANSKKEPVFVTPDSVQMDLMSCRFTQEEPQNGKTDGTGLSDTEGYEVVMENQSYKVFYRAETNNIRVENKKNGYVWGSLVSDSVKTLNTQWTQMANALVTIKYLDAACTSYQSSVGGGDFACETAVKDSRMTFHVSNAAIGIAFGFTLTLYDDGLQIAMIKNSLVESRDYLLESLYFMPFFGCADSDTMEGYMFVPDGSGALIRYNKSMTYLSPFDKRIYGLDMGVDQLGRVGNLMSNRPNDYLTDSMQATVPVFGVAHGAKRNAFLAVIDGGTAYVSVYASPAGFVTDYHWVTARFDFRTVYTQIVKKDGSGVQANQRTPNSVTPSIRYYFLANGQADYSGMAVKYREILSTNGGLPGGERVDSDVPLRVDALAADVKTGGLFKSYVPMTTTAQAAAICDSLYASGIGNLTFVYKGWKSGGMNGGHYGDLGFDQRLGSLSELGALKNRITAGGGRLFLSLNPIIANKAQTNYNNNAALTMSRRVSYFERSNPALAYPRSYVMKPSLVLSLIEKATKKYSDYRFAFDGIGIRAYGDYSRGDVILRDQTISAFVEKMENTRGNIALTAPNQYLWNSATEYFDLPLENSQYLYETDSVPFLPIVLKGSVDYYSPYVNQGYYTQEAILKIIEYGAYPSFFVMAASNDRLSQTPSEDYFSLNFEDWKPTIERAYNQINDVLKAVEGTEITEHTVFKTGIVKIGYTNGVNIYINYNSSAHTLDTGAVIPEKGCLVIGGSAK
jgi:hypothetical protein